MYHCKACGHHINLDKDGVGYCPICDKKVSYGDVVPEKCNYEGEHICVIRLEI